MNEAQADMPGSQAEPQPEENPELSPKALRHLPQEILDMLGSAVLPEGMARDGGSSDSLSPEEGDGKQISDGQSRHCLPRSLHWHREKTGCKRQWSLLMKIREVAC